MNVVNLVGRVGKEPTIKYSKDGKTIAEFKVAVNRYGQKTDWIPCVAFGKSAEIIEKYFHKGSRIGLTGAWSTGSYDGKNGHKVFTHNCSVTSIDFIDTKAESNFSDTPAMPDVDTSSDFMNLDASGDGEEEFFNL